MFEVAIDTRDLVEQLGDEADEVIGVALNALGEFALDRIRQESSTALGIETQDQYTRALQMTQSRDEVVISLTDPAMAALEIGHESFDIKPGMLRSPKAKRAHGGGSYIDVPFTHKVTKRGKGTYVESRAKRKAITTAMSQAKSTGAALRIFKGTKNAPRTIHTDMKVSPEGAAQTFRRISENSPADSWIHPGREGLGIFESTAHEVERIKNDVIADILEARSGA